MFNKLNILLFFVLISVGNIYSQNNNYSITGTISDQVNAVIPNATVNIRNKNTGNQKSTSTDLNGKFFINNISNGIYQLTVQADGYSSSSKEIVVNNTDITNLLFNLKVGDISEEVSVTATRTQVVTTDTVVSVNIIDREQLERKNVNTIGDVFRNLPGVSTVNEGSFQVRPRIRGFDSNRVLVLVDGERLNNGRTSTIQSGVEIGLVGTEQIQTLEVVRGSGSVLYGTDALGGTINIITSDAPRNSENGFQFGATFNGLFSSNETGRRGNIALTGASKFFSFRVAQSLERYSNYFSGDLNGRVLGGLTDENEVLNSQSHGSNTKITTRFFFDDNNDLKLNYDRRRVGNIGVPSLVGVFNAYFPFSDRDKFNARFETRNINEKLARLSASFYFQNQKRNFTNVLDVPAAPPIFPRQYEFSETITDTDSLGIDVQSDWVLGSKNFLTAGFSFFRDENSDSRFRELREPDFSTFPPGLVTSFDTSPSVPNANFGSFAVFAQNQFDFTDRIKLVGGIRIERFFSNSTPTNGFSLPLTDEQIEALGLAGLEQGLNTSQTALTGDFGLLFRLTNAISLTGKIGRSFRVPNLFERFFSGAGSIGGLIVGNPNLDPESGINIDTGIKYKSSKFAGSITYFNNTYRNLLSNEQIGIINGTPVTIPNGLFQTINIGRARIQGFEAEFEAPVKIGFGFLTPSGNISYLHGDDLEANQPLTTITPLKTVLNLRWQNFLNNYYFDWTTRIVNKQTRLSEAFLDVNGGAEPGFVVSDLGGGYIYKKEKYRLSINAGVKNVFNRFYNEQFVFAPARGRSFVVGSTLQIN
jgi:hemoglobin/transferrin/lactoferrin receptor protein